MYMVNVQIPLHREGEPERWRTLCTARTPKAAASVVEGLLDPDCDDVTLIRLEKIVARQPVSTQVE